MKGVRGAIRILLTPQGLLLWAALLLVFNASNPGIPVPVASNSRFDPVLGVPKRISFRPTIPGFTKVYAAGIDSRAANTLRAFAPVVDCVSQKCIALSFDDGPNPQTTPRVLDVLEQKHATASFFVVGKYVGSNQDVIRRMNADGFEIGNHTWDHADLTRLPADQVRSELIRTQTAVGAIGVYPPKLFRPPYGAVDPSITTDAGLQVALWNEDPRDWQAVDAMALTQTVISDARPGGVVDLHDTHQVTVDALPGILDGLSAQGFRFVTVSQLLHSRDRPDQTPFYGYHP